MMVEKIKNLVKKLIIYNDTYRKGNPTISDSEYDRKIELLKSLDPYNPFLKKIEPEKFRGKNRVIHVPRMLSMQKAYNLLTLTNFVRRAEKEADSIGIKNVEFKLTAKLDGLAGNDNGKMLISRGDGNFGYDISNVFSRGAIPIGGRGNGLGEIVVVKSYFKKYMHSFFEHPRNMVVGIALSEKLNINVEKALNNGKIHFVPYAKMKYFNIYAKELLNRYKYFYDLVLKNIDYPVDGVVVEVVNNNLQNYMGFTAHHYCWQIAIKTKSEIAKTTVNNIIWQVGRSGVLTPVLEIEPVHISGATIKRVNAHNAKNIKILKIGIGSVVEIIRSGEVIPKLESVIKQNNSVKIPTLCPVCHSKLNWDNNFIKCLNYNCTARVKQRIIHWFKTLNNTEWFGRKTIQRIIDGGYNTLESIYKMNIKEFMFLDFTQIQAKNLYDAINSSLVNPVNDWRFLAAFGIPRLGLGDSRKLLSKISIYNITSLKKELIISLAGFGDKTSKLIEEGIKKIQNTISNMIAMKFNLLITKKVYSNKLKFYGKEIVFTGKMETGLRNDFKSKALHAGFQIKNKVGKKTDYLIKGLNGSKSKIDAANNIGITILTEKQYLDLIDTISSDK